MKNIIKKLFKIQGLNLTFQKTEDNPFFHSKYLPLEELQKKLNPILQDNNLLVLHYTKNNCVVTEVADVDSGESITSEFPLQTGLEPQRVGSTISYGKRYNLGQLFNIITDDDDDGNASATPQNALGNGFKQKMANTTASAQTPAQNELDYLRDSTTHICSKCGSAPRTSKTTGKMYCPNAYQGDKKIAGHTIIERNEKVIQLDESDKKAEEAFLANMGL